MSEAKNEAEASCAEVWSTPEVETSRPSELWAVLATAGGCVDPPNDQD